MWFALLVACALLFWAYGGSQPDEPSTGKSGGAEAGINCEDGYTYERTLDQAAKVDVERAIARVARAYGVRARDLRGSTPLPDETAVERLRRPLRSGDGRAVV
jgi:hypothetical protein